MPNIDVDGFTLLSGREAIRVDVDQLDDNPLDEDGRTRFFGGERVVVIGRIDDADLFEGREIAARSVVVLSGRRPAPPSTGPNTREE